MPRLNSAAERRIRDQAIAKRHRAGASHHVLAAEFGLSEAMVARILQRDLGEAERRDIGRRNMRDARLGAVARERSADSSLSLSRAARLHGVSHEALRERIESGEVRATRIQRGARTDFRLDPDELRADLENFRCRYPGCERYGLGTSGCCSPAHAGKVNLAGRPRPQEVIEKITATKRKSYPIAGERFCENESCGKSLGIKSVARVSRGDGHYCSLACAGAGRSAGFRAELAEFEKAGRVTLSSVADRLALHRVSIHGYARTGRLVVERHRSSYGIGFETAAAKDVSRFLRDLAREENPQRARWLAPDFAIAVARRRGIVSARAARHGLSEPQVEALIAHATEERRRALARHRAGRRSTTHQQDWAAAFADVRDYYERRACVGDPLPSRLQMCIEVAHSDAVEHPERWSYDPANLRRQAGDRVWKGIKPLLIAQNK